LKFLTGSIAEIAFGFDHEKYLRVNNKTFPRPSSIPKGKVI
jgi:hypothetical protein